MHCSRYSVALFNQETYSLQFWEIFIVLDFLVFSIIFSLIFHFLVLLILTL